jgi:hypothetical protein
MAHHKGRGILFGGVNDTEQSEEGMDSEFFNLLFAYNVDRNRFFQLALRRPRTSGKKATPAVERSKRGRGKADEEDLLRNLALIEGKGHIDDENEPGGKLPASDNDDDDDDEEASKIEKPVMWEMPHPRFNAQLAVQDDTLFIFGGTFEKGDHEFTFDEMFSIDLGKLDGVREVFKRELEDWQGSDDDESDEENSDDEYSDIDDSDADADDNTTSARPTTPATSIGDDVPAAPPTPAEPPEEIEKEKSSAEQDDLPMPRPFENLRDFFARSSHTWQDLTLHAMKYERGAEDRSVKEIRKKAFERAEQKWWDCREEIQALEDEQEAAGISEVVSLADRGGEGGVGGAAGRRR